MAQQKIHKLTPGGMPDPITGGFDPDNLNLDEANVAHHNLELVTGKTATAAELKAEEARLLEEYDADAYQRNRRTEFLDRGMFSFEDQFDMIMHDMQDGTTTHQDACQAIKDKWPKDNSGPIE